MVFSRIAESISGGSNLLSATRSSAASYMSPALSPHSDKNVFHGFGFAKSGNKNNLRLSASLQDFSSYHRLDPEAANLIPEIDKSMICSKHPLLRENVAASFSKEKGLPGGTPFLMTNLATAIKPLISWAEKQIPEREYKNTRLFLYATAGVRRLPNADSKWLQENSWSILTGMMGTTPKKATFGARDLGGSSLQCLLSLSGYGLNDAFDKSVVHLLRRLPDGSIANPVNEKIEIKRPCLNSGYNEQYICSQCAAKDQGSGSPLVQGKNLDKGGKSGIPVQLIGALNWEQCSAIAKASVNLSEWSNLYPGIDCDLQPCALSDNLSRPYGQFYALSGFFVIYRFFSLSPETALDDVLEKVCMSFSTQKVPQFQRFFGHNILDLILPSAICLLQDPLTYINELEVSVQCTNLRDGRNKMPLSPTVQGGQQTPFGLGHGLVSSIQLTESSLYPSTSGVSHSYSSSSLGQMQFDSSNMGSFWSPHRSQMRLQSRRSQSREDLNSSLTGIQMGKFRKGFAEVLV
ncbi:putative apyrase 7 [Hibiscus syriacus]|uniref:apyrase n=1 Tax=Hibiscus syriacus TaxID=106335 RepID=A0A6A3BKI9_HIBSY|nr:putative apyrase 7 [Hibiscus syriacus]